MLRLRTVAWPVAAAIVIVASGLSKSQAQETNPAQPKAPQNGEVALPPLEVTAAPTKKAKTEPKAKVAAKAQPAAATASPIASKNNDNAGGSTIPGAVNGYVVKTGSVGTKTDTPLLEIPQSISTVTRKQLEDQKPQSLGDSLAYVPGVRVNQSGFDPRFDTFFIRGFDATYNGIYRDGLRQLSSGFGQFRTEPYGLDSITVLKGPSSALYGAGNAGGIVDMYTKRPTETPFNEIELLVGNHDRLQGNFDLSGPSSISNNVLYRMTGVVRDSDTEALGVPDNRIYLAPALTFKIDPDTKLTVFGEYMKAETGANMMWMQDFSDPDHTRRTNIWSGDPAFNAFDQTQERVGYEIEHRVGDGITLRQKARYAHLKEDAEYIDILEEIAPNVYSRSAGVVASDVHTANADNQLEMKFATGAARHTVLAGLDATYVSYKEGDGYTEDDVPPLVNFNYGQQFIPAPPIDTVVDQDQLAMGAYLQDQIKLDHLVLTLAGRRDWVHTDTATTGEDGVEQSDQARSGHAGLTYLFDSGFAPYIAYGTSFVPNAGVDLGDGTPFKATTAKSKEVGIKYLVPGYNASINAALFDIEQENGVFYDPELDRSVQRGKLRSRGFEIEGNATFDNGLSVLASYSYVDMQIVEGVESTHDGDTAITNGNTLSSTPRNTFSLWADYTMRYGSLRGLGFGSGVRYIGESFGNDRNTFINDAHALIDASAHYDLKGLGQQFAGARLQLNVNNVFDKQDDVCSSDYCYLDQGRTVLGSLRYRW